MNFGFIKQFVEKGKKEKLFAEIKIERRGFDSRSSFAKLIVRYEGKLNREFSEKEIFFFSLLKEGYFIEDVDIVNKNILFFIYSLYLKSLNKKTVILFNSENELSKFYHSLEEYIQDEEEIFSIVDGNYTKIFKKRVFNSFILLTTTSFIAKEMLIYNYEHFHENKVFVKEEFLNRTFLLTDIHGMTMYSNKNYYIDTGIKKNNEFDYNEFRISKDIALKFVDFESLYTIKENKCFLTEEGISFLEEELNISNVFENIKYMKSLFWIENFIFILKNYKKDIDYFVNNKTNIEILNNKSITIENIEIYIKAIEEIEFKYNETYFDFISNQILFSLFKNIQGSSVFVKPYLDYLLSKYNLKYFYLSTLSSEVDFNYTLGCNLERGIIINKENLENLFSFEYEDYKDIYLDVSLNYYYMMEILYLFGKKQQICLKEHINKEAQKNKFLKEYEEKEINFRFFNLINRKMEIFNKIKSKISTYREIDLLIDYLERSLEDLNNKLGLKNEQIIDKDFFINYDKLSLKLIKKEIYYLINIKRVEFLQEINFIISNFYFKGLNKVDPFYLFEKEVYFIVVSYLKEVYTDSLITLSKTKCRRKEINKKIVKKSF